MSHINFHCFMRFVVHNIATSNTSGFGGLGGGGDSGGCNPTNGQSHDIKMLLCVYIIIYYRPYSICHLQLSRVLNNAIAT